MTFGRQRGHRIFTLLLESYQTLCQLNKEVEEVSRAETSTWDPVMRYKYLHREWLEAELARENGRLLAYSQPTYLAV
jgi:hypothetical protein